MLSDRDTGFPESTPILEIQLQLPSNSLLARAPSISAEDVPVTGGGCGEQPELALQGWYFSLRHQRSTCKLRGLKCSLSGRVWQENEVKVTLLPNLNSTVVLELLKLEDILMFQGKLNFFSPFSKTKQKNKNGSVSPTSTTCYRHIRAKTHTRSSTATDILTLLSEEMGLF